ncbi:MAG: pyridoxamine 5'-phosphate oxidase family protein [Burkholderiales bacterium]
MARSATVRKDAVPKPARPHMPGYGIAEAKAGKGLLPWKWALEPISKARNYWIATTRPDERPHVMTVWAVWLDGQLLFSTGKTSRKARNLARNPNCVLCPRVDGQAVIVEGIARQVKDPALLKRFMKAVYDKYAFDMTSMMHEPVFGVRPRVVFGWSEKTDADYPSTATRWVFG